MGDAEQSVAFADRSGDAFQRMGKRTTLADALHQAGRREEAVERFREAEAMQAERQPEYPLLYSLRGFRYCDLLLAGAERAAGGGPEDRGAGEACDEVERRARRRCEWADLQQRPRSSTSPSTTSPSAAPGSTGRSSAAPRPTPPGPRSTRPSTASAGPATIEFAARGLLTRAWLRSVLGDPDGARADLAEAQEIAERGPMPLFLADVHLYRARLFHDRAALADARPADRQARLRPPPRRAGGPGGRGGLSLTLSPISGYITGTTRRCRVTATRRAVRKHRRNLKKRGILRVEVQASPADAGLLRSAARVLAGNSADAARVRRLLREELGPELEALDLKELIESAPLEGIDLTRRRDLPRDVEL